jgi:hypothetical protein
MTSMSIPRGVRVLLVAAGCALLLAIALISFRTTTGKPPATTEKPAATTERPPAAPPAWQTVEYQGVRIDLPATWARSDTSGCEFQFPKWAPPGSAPCDAGTSAGLYGSATFDPAYGPGVRKTTGAGTWAGWVYAGDFAVYATGTDRELVQRVLDSARPAGR